MGDLDSLPPEIVRYVAESHDKLREDRESLARLETKLALQEAVQAALSLQIERLENRTPKNALRLKLRDGHHHMESVRGVDNGTDAGFAFEINARVGMKLSRGSWPNNRRLDLDAVGFGFCLDVLVSSCWATEVAAGRGAEGEQFTGGEGCTFAIYSTIQGAATYAATLGRAASIGICPGEYRETLIFTTQVHITGFGDLPIQDSLDADDNDRAYAYVNPSATQTAATFDFQDVGTASSVRNVAFKARDNKYCIDISGNSGTLMVSDCYLQAASAAGSGIDYPSFEAGLVLVVSGTRFEDLAIGINGAGNTRTLQAHDNLITNCAAGFATGDEALIATNRFTNNTVDIQVTSGTNEVRIEGNFSAGCGHFVKHAGGVLENQDLIIANNHAATWSTAFVDLSSMNDSPSGHIAIEGNTGIGASGTTALVLGANCRNLFGKRNRFAAASGTITFRSGGDHPSNHYEDNSAEETESVPHILEGGHGPELKADLLYVVVPLPLEIGWPDFSIDWGGAVVDYSAGTVVLTVSATNKIYADSSGNIIKTTGAWPTTPHKKLAEFVTGNTAGAPDYTSHTWFAPLLDMNQAAPVSGAVPADRVLGILYDAGGLNIGWNAFITREDNVMNSITAGTLSLTDNDINYVEVTGTTVSANTTGFTAGSIPLGTVVTSGADITSITEETAVLAMEKSHDILTNVSADDHHAKYTDAEARAAVPFVFYIPLGTDIDGAPVTP